ncbi:MAG: DUF4446 family protein [Negativicutes bacterium]|jgi:hypothetical protein
MFTPEIISLVAIGVSALMLIWLIVIAKRFQDIQTRYRKMLHGANVANIEQLLMNNHENYNKLVKYKTQVEKELAALTAKVEGCTQKIAVKRYNPFEDVGGDLSYSVALLDDHNSGVVLSSIYSRHESRSYAKSVTDGKSEYRLSTEEQQAIEEASRSLTQPSLPGLTD